ncbi:MAG: TolC family protein [Thermoclostridium sp.]|nr:TolC family protein [Thermoclostridium sp.]
MKRVLFFVLLLVFSCSVLVFAEETITRFTYESALETAVQNSIQPSLDDSNIRAKESALEKAKEDARDKGFIGGTLQQIVENSILREVTPLEAETAIETARRQKADNERVIKAEVYQEMMRVLLARDSVTLKEQKLELAEEKLKIDKIQYQEGLIAEADIINEDLAISVDKLDLVKAQTQLKSNILDIKQRLHVDLGDENQIAFDYKLDKVGTHYVLGFFNLNNAIDKAIAADTSVYSKEKAIEYAQMKLDLTAERLKPGNDYYDKKVYEVEAAQKALYDAKTNLEVSIRNAHNDLLTALDALELANKKLDLENSRLNTLKTKLNAGVISRRDMIDTEINVVSRKQEVLQAICDFNVKNDVLRDLLGD